MISIGFYPTMDFVRYPMVPRGPRGTWGLFITYSLYPTD